MRHFACSFGESSVYNHKQARIFRSVKTVPSETWVRVRDYSESFIN